MDEKKNLDDSREDLEAFMRQMNTMEVVLVEQPKPDKERVLAQIKAEPQQQRIRRFWDETEGMTPSADALREFCRAQSRFAPNLPFPTAGGGELWATLADWWGWRVQENVLTGHVRILDPEDVRKAWGPEEQLLPALWRHLQKRCQYCRDCSAGGIVFCGGGAKGAYQIGVWKRLREMGLEAQIGGVSGASVGALNSLLFTQGDLELAEDVWLSIRQEDMVRPGSFDFKTFLQSMGTLAGGKGAAAVLKGLPMRLYGRGLALDTLIKLERPYLLAGSVLSAGAAACALNNWATSAGLFSREFLEDIIERRISPETIRQTDRLVYSSLAALSLPHVPEKGEKPQSILFNAEYHCWQGLSFPEIQERVLASAALPVAYAPVRLDGKLYTDGGVVDNFPVRPLAEAGFPIIFVVHLSNPVEVRKRAEARKQITSAAGDSLVVHIWPSRSVGETLEISPDLTRKRMALGYEDACKQLAEFEFA